MQSRYQIIIGLIIFFLLEHGVYAAPQELRIPKPLYADSLHQAYFTQLLHKALLAGANGREVPGLKETNLFEQERAISELKNDLIDVYWLGTDNIREQSLRPIRIPLDRGLLGVRKFIIHRDMQEAFDKINNLQALKKMRACQGPGWPDTKIMKSAGLSVTETSGFEHLLQQVASKRCDYFPRGYFEIDAELRQNAQTYPMLIGYQSLVLYYPFTVYFFVNKKNEDLAQWLEQGLEKMIDSGELLGFMQHHPLTASVFPLAKKNNVHTIDIANPLLPPNTDFKNPRYWIQPEELLVDVSNAKQSK